VWGKERVEVGAVNPAWRKWLPSNPTSAHWYDLGRFTRLVAAYLAHDEDRGQGRTVREFVAEFDGLSGTAKQAKVLESVGMKRAPLTWLVRGGAVCAEAARELLLAMQRHSKPVNPQRLGCIGKHSLRSRLVALGCQEESFGYKVSRGVKGDLPWVSEVAFGYRPEAKSRRLITGVNWSPGVGDPFRSLGASGYSLSSLLSGLYAGPDDPVVVLVHLACPRVEYTDRGKSAVVVDGGGTDHNEEEE
jgi:hypothetical protein